MICALLNDAGIPAHLENWHHAMIDWGVLQALGGVGVLVPASEAVAARETIIAYVQSADERLHGSFPELETTPLKQGKLRQYVLISYYTGLILIPFMILFMLIEVAHTVSAHSAGGPFRWDMLGAYLAAAHWGYFLAYAAFAAASFLVPLSILVFLSRRFLARHSEVKATP